MNVEKLSFSLMIWNGTSNKKLKEYMIDVFIFG